MIYCEYTLVEGDVGSSDVSENVECGLVVLNENRGTAYEKPQCGPADCHARNQGK